MDLATAKLGERIMDIEHVEQQPTSVQLVVFTLGQEEYGVMIQYVKEIIRKPEITQLPNAPDFIRGVINLRGEIIPILSLSGRFHLEDDVDSKESKVVIVEFADLTVGMEVNEVSEVLTLDTSNISQTPSMATSVNSMFISGVGQLDKRLLIILDVEQILSDKEHSLLKTHLESVDEG